MCASGPNKDQEVRWVYTRAGMPVEITAEFENWRRIRDWEGAEGWVYHSLLSGKRTAVVVPNLKDDLVPLYESAGRRIRGGGAPAIRRARPAEILQRDLVRVHRQEFQRLDPAGAAVGRLSEREGGVDRCHRPRRMPVQPDQDRHCPKSDGWNSRGPGMTRSKSAQLFRRSRTTTSTRAIS